MNSRANPLSVERRRIAFLRISRAIDVTEAVGGIERVLASQAIPLAASGWAVTILLGGIPAVRKCLVRFFESRGLKCIELEAEGLLAASRKLKEIVRRDRVDVLVAENHREMVAATLAMMKNRRSVLLWRHHTLASRGGWGDFVNRCLDKVVLCRVCGHIVISEMLRHALSETCGIRKPIYLVPNCAVAADASQHTVTASPSPLPRRVGIIARLDERKGHDTLLAALHQLKEYRIEATVIGDGCNRDALVAMAEQLGLSGKVQFLGELSNPWTALQDTEIFILPSLNEGSPLVLLEACARKKLIIASRVGAVCEIVEDGTNGFLIPPGNADALAGLLVRIFRSPSTTFYEQRMAAFKRYQEHFNIEKSALALESALLSATGQATRGAWA